MLCSRLVDLRPHRRCIASRQSDSPQARAAVRSVRHQSGGRRRVPPHRDASGVAAILGDPRTEEAAPVFLWHHETGAFHLQFDGFARFVVQLRTPQALRDHRAKIRQVFASIRRECRPALSRARHFFEAGKCQEAARELDTALRGRRPIAYDGSNDFTAISILCDCFNLRGRVLLTQGRLKAARSSFLDATACGGTPYPEAVVNVIATSFLLKDVGAVLKQVGDIRADDLGQPLGRFLKQNFTAKQIAELRALATSRDIPPEQRALAAEVLTWTY